MARNSILKRYGYTALVSIIVARFSPWLNGASRLMESDGSAKTRAWLGSYGENVAAAYLRSNGCRILARNYRSPRRGEVDIIARDGRVLLFVEVKTRAHDSSIRGLDAVNRNKQALIERGANSWLKQLGTRDLPWRFDVIEVKVKDGGKPQINHVRDAF